MYLLDTNVLIYVLHDNEEVMNLLFRLEVTPVYISSMTRFEIEVGAEKEVNNQNDWMRALDECIQLPFDAKVVAKAVPIFLKLGAKRHMFKDAIIAATAIVHNLTLLTADKAFESIPDLKVMMIEI